MPMDAVLTCGVIATLIVVLATSRLSADVVLMGGLTVLLVFGVVSPAEALGGFSNTGLVTVAVLYVVVAGMRETGAVSWIASGFLGSPKSLAGAQGRMIFPVAVLSAFVNNTPIVAMMIPAVRDWAERTGLSVSHLLIPLSYAAIIGGTCTIIGTSTNLVLNGMLLEETGHQFGLFDIAVIGVPCLIVVTVYILLFTRYLLSANHRQMIDPDQIKQYLVEMLVEPGSNLSGKSIEEAGLRHLPGLYLIDIERGGVSMPAVSPEEKLQVHDRLVFTGMVESVADLQRFDGLRIASDHIFKLNSQRSNHALVEVVVSEACPLVGKTIREGNFRNVYNAAVIAVSRNGEHVHAKVGDVVLQAGDMLLLEAHVDFARQHRNSKDFMLVSSVEDSQPYNVAKRPVALVIFAAMIFAASLELTSLLIAGMVAAGALMITGCISASGARREISWQVLIIIGASIGLGNALFSSGAAAILSDGILELVGIHSLIILALVFILTATLTAVITNIAAATLMFPIVQGLSDASGVSLFALVATLMVAASASFATPIGYQTNLMVYGPGGYHFRDFVKMGLPLTVPVGVVTVVMAYHFF